jgi:membrane protease YdiL (CAAX protease family)
MIDLAIMNRGLNYLEQLTHGSCSQSNRIFRNEAYLLSKEQQWNRIIGQQRKLNGLVIGIASATLLSRAGILPPYVYKASCYAMISHLIYPLIKKIYIYICSILFKTVVDEDMEDFKSAPEEEIKNYQALTYVDELLKERVMISCVYIPILEEIMFRLIAQTALQSAFHRVLPNAMARMPLFGTSLSVATLSAMGVTSVIFGAGHYKKTDLAIRPFHIGISAFFTESYLFQAYGIGACIFCHLTQNTLCLAVNRLADAARFSNRFFKTSY